MQRWFSRAVRRHSHSDNANLGGAAGHAQAVQRLADQFYRRSVARGGWAAEIGGVGPRAFEAEARLIIAQIALGNAQAGPPTP
ncbi:MAG: hypothetical protein U0821_20500 [Chloroflexota bacterium]